jgi:hypothetical protein
MTTATNTPTIIEGEFFDKESSMWITRTEFDSLKFFVGPKHSSYAESIELTQAQCLNLKIILDKFLETENENV